MLGKLLTSIAVVELIGVGVLGTVVYSEFRYHQGRMDAYREVNETLGKLIIGPEEKHESEEKES